VYKLLTLLKRELKEAVSAVIDAVGSLEIICILLNALTSLETEFEMSEKSILSRPLSECVGVSNKCAGVVVCKVFDFF
jgi:hypothetical protein